MNIFAYYKVNELDSLIAESSGPGVRFLLPSRRDRAWWKKRARQDNFGLDSASLSVFWNWEDLYSTVCSATKAPALRQIDPHDNRLILSHLVRELLLEKEELVRLWPGLARPGFLDILSTDIRELLNEGILPEQMESGLPEENASPTDHVLPLLFRRYLKYLSDHSLMDSSQLPWIICRLLASVSQEEFQDTTLIFTGFMSFTHSQVELIRALEGRCREIKVFKPEASLPALQDAARQLEGLTWECRPEDKGGELLALRSSEQATELEFLARELALWHSGEGRLFQATGEPLEDFGEVGILTSPGALSLLKEFLSRYNIPHTAERGVNLDETLPGRLFVSAWTLWEQGFGSYETALFLSYPCFAGPDFPVDSALKAGPAGFAVWKKYLAEGKKFGDSNHSKAFARAGAALRAVNRFCSFLNSGATPGHLMEALHRFLTEKGLWVDAMLQLPIHQNPELDEALRETTSSIAATENKALALRELLPDIGPVGQELLRGREALNFLKSWSQETRIRPDPPLTGAVTLCSAPPPVLASWPIWIMADVTQTRWSGKVSDSPLIDEIVRERLSQASAWLPSLQDKRVQREALFRRLLQTGDRWTLLTRAEHDTKERPLSDPLFLSSFLKERKSWRLREIPQDGDGLLPGSDVFFPDIEASPSVQTQRRRPVLRSPRSEAFETQSLSISISDLETLLDCPMRWWLQKKACLRERSLEIFSEAERGNLLHKFWEQVWGAWRGMDKFSNLVEKEWQKLFTAQPPYDAFDHLILDPRFQHRLSTLEYQLYRAGASQEQTLNALNEVGYRHQRVLREDEAVMSLDLHGVTFRGRCDRVDILQAPDGGLHAVIIDYKGGRGGKNNSYDQELKELSQRPWLLPENGNPKELEKLKFGLQLSFYALLFSRLKPDVTLAGVGILGHRDGLVSGTFTPPLNSCYVTEGTATTSMDERLEEAEHAALCAARLLKKGVFPSCRIASSCRWCDMKSLCRKGEFFGEVVGQSEWEESPEGDA
ncbi:MAG: hypothetical protein GX256_00710 [Fretibacterium sp.]|nr:hypothetical protein [Fretibacterium sp.]